MNKGSNTLFFISIIWGVCGMLKEYAGGGDGQHIFVISIAFFIAAYVVEAIENLKK